MSELKKGRFSKQEKYFIENNIHRSSPQEIAVHLNRDPDSVEKYCRKNLKYDINAQESEEIDAEYSLKTREFWKDLQLQLDEDEQKMFLYHWKRIIGQFRNDVLPTEELQIVDLIRTEIVISRCLKEQKKIQADIRQMEADIQEERDTTADIDIIRELGQLLSSFRAQKQSLSKEYKELEGKKTSLYKDLKGTRDQRVKNIENRKKTFASLLTDLRTNPEFVKRCNEYMEKMRLGIEEQTRKMGDYHQYDETEVDRILLNSETVMMEPEKEEDDDEADI